MKESSPVITTAIGAILGLAIVCYINLIVIKEDIGILKKEIDKCNLIFEEKK